jgi:hypothetical protein
VCLCVRGRERGEGEPKDTKQRWQPWLTKVAGSNKSRRTAALAWGRRSAGEAKGVERDARGAQAQLL